MMESDMKVAVWRWLGAFVLVVTLSVAPVTDATTAFAREALTKEDPKNEGVIVKRPSFMRKLVSAEALEQQSLTQYKGLIRAADSKRALLPAEHPQVRRLHAIARKIIPFTPKWNDRTGEWKWEVNLIASPQLNAFCMPGGKIVFFAGIIEKLRLTDDEIAVVMGHEMAHALREHARARMAKSTATNLGARALSVVLGLGNLGDAAAGMGAQLLTLKFSRGDETEADLIGMELAARAGFDPRAGVVLWQKMGSASQGAPPQWLSTHPASKTRIADMQKQMDRVLPLYARATGQTVQGLRPYAAGGLPVRQPEPRSR
jgi:Zn-dependent protease with chaperone function